MFISLVLLIALAVMAHQSKKIVLSAVLFGGLKALASVYYLGTEVAYEIAVLVGASQFLINGALGLGIAYLVVKKSQEWKLVFANTFLSLMTFLTALVDQAIVA